MVHGRTGAMFGQDAPRCTTRWGWLVTANANQTMGQWWVYKRYGRSDRCTDEHHSRQLARRHGCSRTPRPADRSQCWAPAATPRRANVTVRYKPDGRRSWSAVARVNVLVERMPLDQTAFVQRAPDGGFDQPRPRWTGGSFAVTINWDELQ